MRVTLLATLIALLTGCAMPKAQAEPAPEVSKEQETRIVVLQDGEKRELRFSGSNWRESAEWQALLQELAPEQAARLEALLVKAPLPPLPPLPKNVEIIEENGVRRVMVLDADGQPLEQKIIKIRAEAAGHRFEAIKRLLESTELTKEQLLELQKILDAKH